MKENRKDNRVELPKEVEAGLGLLNAILAFFSKDKKKKRHHRKHRREER